MDDDGVSDGVTLRMAARPPKGFDEGRLRRDLALAVRESGLSVARLHVEVLDDDEMARLHRTHSGVAGSTDVLTFPHSEPGEPIDADVAVCLDVGVRHAEALGHGAERELLLYVVHALLHCGGHDDHDPAAFGRMHAEEDRILDAIGVGPTFDPLRLDGSEPTEASR